ncbi:MAG TPA: hypothetical protein VK163_06335 [Opitutaceae bacterium]|nr:hypothetical protein [Opitutaceae bacterium]
MTRVRSAGNASTELRLVALLRATGITGWRRGCSLRLRGQAADSGGRRMEFRRQLADAGDGRLRADRCSREQRHSGLAAPGSPRAATARKPLTVKPDFVFRKERLVVFVDGCFSHGCPWHFTRPKARRAFWEAKIAANKARDRRIDRALRAAGWRVLLLWEHALRPRAVAPTLARVRRALG